MLVDTGRRTAPADGMFWGGDDGIEAKQRDEQDTDKGNRNQKTIPTGIDYGVVHDYLMYFSYEKLLIQSIGVSSRD